MKSAIVPVVTALTISAGASGQTVWAWEYNNDGQCNVPHDLGDCTSVAAGRFHSIAICADGSVRAWGANSGGQCNVPTSLGPCIAVAAGDLHTVAIRADGAVQAWGANSDGQCVVPTGLGPCTAVAAGSSHSIVLLANGTIRAWGANYFAQSVIPADLGACVAVEAGQKHSVALQANGTVRAWGWNSYGQCNVPTSLGPCIAVAAGDLHTVAIRADGAVQAWGANSHGQCTVPHDLGPCITVAAGSGHTVALLANGTIRAWGDNQLGQRTIPANLGSCTAIAAGCCHSIALTGLPPPDADGDGMPDAIDNCPGVANPSQSDCDSNGIGDACQIGFEDRNANNIPDYCECTACECIADLNSDGKVSGADIGILLGEWGAEGGTTGADINRDGTVTGADLGALLGAWGQCGVPAWATLIEFAPDPAIVTNVSLRSAITATGLPWRVRDTATQIEMLLVPPGTFDMGCSIGSSQYPCQAWELPVHEVTLTNAFYLGRYEVTQAQWRTRMGSVPGYASPSWFQASSSEVGVDQVPARPVERVSWNLVQGGFLLGTGLRLPTEAEWEFACRAGTQTPFYNGSAVDSTVGGLAWYAANSTEQTRPVGGRAPNSLGFHDMLGNVGEMVNDYSGGYFAAPQTNPAGPAAGSSRVVRGGSWDNLTREVRSSNRYGQPPDVTTRQVGFRVARTP